MNEITNVDDVINTRSVAERIEELELDDERWDIEEEELTALRHLAEQIESVHGPVNRVDNYVIIHDSHFKEYAREYAEETGVIDPGAVWPACHIDWDAAADELRSDHTEITFDGVTYWLR